MTVPTVQVIEEKSEAIRKALTYRFSSFYVDKILQSKEKFSKHPHNYAMTKAKLQKEREQQLDAGNQVKIKPIRALHFEDERYIDECNYGRK